MQIKKLKIYSSQIQEQADFYAEVLGLKIIHRTDRQVRIAIGRSILEITYKATTTPYHFAINIPANKDQEALKWLRSKVEILKDGKNEIQDFDSWNAKAIYFYDKDKNIVELISRNNLKNASSKNFGIDQFIEISEIGLGTTDIEKEFNYLNNHTGIEIFDGGFDRFCAIGDENGLFICINKKVKDWFPTNDKVFSSEFIIHLIERGKEYQFAFKNQALKIGGEFP